MVFQKNGVSLYCQVENYMREKICKGEWSSGEQIPTEVQLMELFGVSRATLRQAVSNLCNEGLLNRIQGKGTYVTDTSGYGNDPTEIWEHAVKGVTHKAISCVEKSGLKGKSSQLMLPPDEVFTVFSYLHYVDTQSYAPYNLCVSYFPKSRFPKIENYFYADSVYAILKSVYHVSLAYSESEFHIVNLTKEQASYLEVKSNTPTIRIEKIYFDRLRNPIFCTDIFAHPTNSLLRITTECH